MPRTGSTALKPNLKRPVLSDLRSKVIGTNTLLIDTNAKLDLMIEAQTKMVDVLTGLLVKIANGAVQKTLERMTDDAAVFTSQPSFTPTAPRDASNTTGSAYVIDPGAEIDMIPRGTSADAHPKRDHVHALALQATDGMRDRDYQDSAEAIASTIDADMAAELAEYAAQDDELPEQDDDDLWTRRLSLHRAMRMWKPEWGAMPGQAGCQVPPHLLNGRG